jgi:hypothetical protein
MVSGNLAPVRGMNPMSVGMYTSVLDLISGAKFAYVDIAYPSRMGSMTMGEGRGLNAAENISM